MRPTQFFFFKKQQTPTTFTPQSQYLINTFSLFKVQFKFLMWLISGHQIWLNLSSFFFTPISIQKSYNITQLKLKFIHFIK